MATASPMPGMAPPVPPVVPNVGAGPARAAGRGAATGSASAARAASSRCSSCCCSKKGSPGRHLVPEGHGEDGWVGAEGAEGWGMIWGARRRGGVGVRWWSWWGWKAVSWTGRAAPAYPALFSQPCHATQAHSRRDAAKPTPPTPLPGVPHSARTRTKPTPHRTAPHPAWPTPPARLPAPELGVVVGAARGQQVPGRVPCSRPDGGLMRAPHLRLHSRHGMGIGNGGVEGRVVVARWISGTQACR